jgi:lipopolysaccharide/colanic/teichoic acid biosynthesis glycosyltransferase
MPRSDEHGAIKRTDKTKPKPVPPTIVDLTGDEVGLSADWPAPERRRSAYERYVKPAVDRIGGFVLLILTAPMAMVVALAIRLTLGHPVIIRQQRVGVHGTVFTLYKFRTMEPDRRRLNGPYDGEERRRTHKHPRDPRITRLGRFLRSWSLDELPQFYNVVRGEMSLVGPRPEMVEIVARYQPWQHARHAVKPGLTGLWQISERGDRMMHEATETDLEYLEKISFWTDLRIMVLTPLAALGLRRGH